MRVIFTDTMCPRLRGYAAATGSGRNIAVIRAGWRTCSATIRVCAHSGPEKFSARFLATAIVGKGFGPLDANDTFVQRERHANTHVQMAGPVFDGRSSRDRLLRW